MAGEVSWLRGQGLHLILRDVPHARDRSLFAFCSLGHRPPPRRNGGA